MKKVFVYGTLKRGGRFHDVIEHCEFVGNKIIKGFDLYNYANSYPIAIIGDKEHVIKGEVYNISENNEKTLDSIEGYPYLYQKHIVDDVMLYYMEDKNNVINREDTIIIKDGIWKN